MATVVSFDIGAVHATWHSAVRTANLVFAGDKEDTGTETTVDEQSEYAGEVWGNSVDQALDQCSEIFNGLRVIQALGIGSLVSVASGNGNDLVVGPGSGNAGMTLYSANTGECSWMAGDPDDPDAGRWIYNHSTPGWEFWVEGVQELNLTATVLGPTTDGGLDLATTTSRFATGYVDDLEVTDTIRVSSGGSANSAADDVVLGSTTSGVNHGLTIFSDSTHSCAIYMGDEGDNNAGRLVYDHGVGWELWVEGTQELNLSATVLGPQSDAGLDLGTATVKFGTTYTDTVAAGANTLTVGTAAQDVTIAGTPRVPVFTVATLPAATTGGVIHVSDETGGHVLAFSDGTNWRRSTDRAIVS